MNLFDLVATLRLDTTQYENAIGKTSQGVDGMKKSFTALKVAGVAAFTAVTAMAVKFGKDSIQAGMEFDKSMSQVAATMGITNEEFNSITVSTDNFSGSLRDLAKEMGSTTAFSATQAGEALNYMALAGYDAQTSAEMLPNVLNLAAAGAMDLGNASDMLTDTQSALGLSIEETTDLVDKMAQTASKSNTSVEQLGSAMLQIGGTAKGMAGGTTELASALGILADNGTKGAEGGTALRNVLLGIQSKKFNKTFGELGVSAYDSDGKLRPLKDTLADMNKVMEGMTDKEKTEMINNAFNKQDLKNVNALLATTTERWDELSEAIEGSEGAAQKMAETQLDNLAGDVTMFKSALEGAQIALSDKLTPALRNIVQIGTDVMGKLTNLFSMKSSNGFAYTIEHDLLPWLAELGGKVLDKIKSLAENLPSVIATLLEKITGYLSAHSGDIVQKGWDLLKSLIKGIIKALPALNNAAGNIMQALVNAIGKMLSLIWDKGVEIAKKLGDAIKSRTAELGNKVKEFAKKIPEKIKEALLGIADIGRNIVSGIWNGISDKAQWLKNMISGWIGNVKSFLKNLFGISSPSKWARDIIGGNIIKGLILGLEQGEDLVQRTFDGIVPDYNGDYATNIDRPSMTGGVSIVNYITVDGAENPEDFTDRFVRRLRMDMRTV